MTDRYFYIDEALQKGWNTMKENFGFYFGILILSYIIVAVPGFIIQFSFIAGSLCWGDYQPMIWLYILFFPAFYIVQLVLQVIIQMGHIRIALMFCDNEKPGVRDLFLSYPVFFRFLACSLLYGLIILGGFVLLIIPGIIWAIQFQFAVYLIVDKKYEVFEALRKSSALTRGIKWRLLGFGIVLAAINFVGALVFIVGLFATIPTTIVAYTYVYRRLLDRIEPPVQAVPA